MKDYYRVLARASLSATLWLSGSSAFAQMCDQCDSAPAVPTCRCKTCACTEVRTPCGCRPRAKSIGEKILDRLDSAGDRIESRLPVIHGCKSPGCHEASCGCEAAASGPSCGCEASCGCEMAASEPTCGCEGWTRESVATLNQPGLPPIVKRTDAIPNLAPNRMIRAETPSPQRPLEPKLNEGSLKGAVPVESRANRIPFVPRPGNASKNDVVPLLNAKPSKTPDSSPVPNASPNDALPDVLVDPFRDDARSRKSKSLIPTLLTSKAEPTEATMVHASHQKEGGIDLGPAIAPPRLTDRQRWIDDEQGANEVESTVVKSAYVEAVPVNVVRRKSPERSPSNSDGTEPKVSKKKVPSTLRR